MASPFSRVPVPAWRILIGGGGAPGLTLALALSRALGPAVAVTVCDPALARPRPNRRAYAVSPASRRMLEALGIWPGLAADAQPVRRMTITDSRLDEVPRPDYLNFAAEGAEPLAYMLEAERVGEVLREGCRAAGIDLDPHGIAGFAAAEGAVTATRTDGAPWRGALLVAADGSRSRLRDEAGLVWSGRAYDQSGLVATIAHARDHHGRAVQHFLPSGPFAILPLAPGQGGVPYRSSLVWTETTRRVPAILEMSQPEAEREIERRAGPEIGRVTLVSPIEAYPLAIGQARRSVARRFALLGDAAHQIHPLAGQGLNLGLGDAAALAERIVDAVRLGLDPGAPAVLDGYERDRRAATLALSASTDLLNALFSNDVLAVRMLRDLGLGMVDRLPALKRLFVGEATSGPGSSARLLRGEPL